jgi:hypothetical protein
MGVMDDLTGIFGTGTRTLIRTGDDESRAFVGASKVGRNAKTYERVKSSGAGDETQTELTVDAKAGTVTVGRYGLFRWKEDSFDLGPDMDAKLAALGKKADGVLNSYQSFTPVEVDRNVPAPIANLMQLSTHKIEDWLSESSQK